MDSYVSGQRRRPLIGVTGPAGWAPGRTAACVAVRMAGGRARPLAPDVVSGSPALDGLIVTGGSDIDPALYMTSGGPWVASDAQRDKFELTILELALANAIPVLGICRGAQLLNIAHGGSLHSDITQLRRVTSNRPTLLPTKRVTVATDSHLRRILGRDTVKVNSLHHQAVERVGNDLRIVARDGDQIVQGIEHTALPFCIGVQWHPEYLPWRKAHRALFRSLVAAARQ